MRSFMTIRNFGLNPFSLIDEVERDLNALTTFKREGLAGNGFIPNCDFREKDTHYVFSFELPGVAKEDINLEVIDGKLKVSGEKKSYYDHSDYNERAYGRFERVMSLPDDIADSNVEAHFENGILAVAVPKTERPKPKQIEIQNGKKTGFWNRLLTSNDKNKETKTELAS